MNDCSICKGKCCVGIIEVFDNDEIFYNDDLVTYDPELTCAVMKTNTNNQCIALKDGKCSIYDDRPQVCRAFKKDSNCCNSFVNGKITIHKCNPCKIFETK